MASDTPKARLIHLHDTKHMTWREIADLEEYRGIPAGTLCSVAKGDYEPKDLIIRRKLGYQEPEIIAHYRNPKGEFVPPPS